jgi:hypothetical protein
MPFLGVSMRIGQKGWSLRNLPSQSRSPSTTPRSMGGGATFGRLWFALSRLGRKGMGEDVGEWREKQYGFTVERLREGHYLAYESAARMLMLAIEMPRFLIATGESPYAAIAVLCEQLAKENDE